jgi:two-component system, chemotaxis family, response regulator Rcp1
MTTTEQQAKPIEILLVEDNPADVRLAQEVLRESKLINRLCAVTDGDQAMDFLKCRAGYTDAVRPDLILLDLNLPGKDGRQVLAEIKADPDLRRIPVVIVTSSQAEEDVLKTYDLHANCYVTKPVDLDRFVHVVKSIEDFWVSIVKLPTK